LEVGEFSWGGGVGILAVFAEALSLVWIVSSFSTHLNVLIVSYLECRIVRQLLRNSFLQNLSLGRPKKPAVLFKPISRIRRMFPTLGFQVSSMETIRPT
jgi:hypothetical protein